MMPAEHAVDRVMADTGMDRLQAIRHLQSRQVLSDRMRRERRTGSRGVAR